MIPERELENSQYDNIKILFWTSRLAFSYSKISVSVSISKWTIAILGPFLWWFLQLVEHFSSDMGWCQNYFNVIADEGLFPKASINVDKIFRWTFHFSSQHKTLNLFNQLEKLHNKIKYKNCYLLGCETVHDGLVCWPQTGK